MGHALSTRRRGAAAALAPILATGLAVAATHRAAAAGGTASLSGPTSNVMGTDFNYTLSGTASAGSAVISFEQFNRVSGCSATFAGEEARNYLTGSRYEITYWASEAVSGAYSETLAFGAAHLGVHGVCSYLIVAATGATEAHAQAFWTNHS